MQPLLIADGLIPTTFIVSRVLGDAYGRPEVRTAEQLPGSHLSNRPIFISRLCHPRYDWLPGYLRDRGLPYVYVLDDDFFSLTAEQDRHNAAFFNHPAVHQALERFLREAAAVWVMSEVLAQRLSARVPGCAPRFVPAPVDIELFDGCHARRGPRARPVDVLTIGYPSTRRPNVAVLLASIVDESERRWGASVHFEFFGWCPDGLAERANVTSLPAVSPYEAFVQAAIDRHWDVAIAPLGDSAFENAKTNLKFREYAAMRVPGIYSRVPLYTACVRDGENGLLAEAATEAWLAAIDRLREDAGLRRRLAHAAREDALCEHEQSRVAARLRETFADCWRSAL